ncbi:AGE family epimerase/isomerase [Seramator thermalis]|jgi:mannobiose 2-epimerase|uniref:AGE family epimerase/isomerase n=1 Tax=Seramator thermalis TaxID=2496270 RepID=UPI0013EB2B6F|nr:AGE family epimerase/isomerase [Seramator thermalis]
MILQFDITVTAESLTISKSQQLVNEVVEDLQENILPFWIKYAPDPLGGFYGTLKNNGEPIKTSQKGSVLNARILWTFSAAYLIFNDSDYKEIADRAQKYFVNHFIDTEYGGTYWSVNADGSPGIVEKQTYGIAFGIYGLAEHYRATNNCESLQYAIELYRTLEKYSFDNDNGGYIESFTRNWKKPERYGYDGKGIAEKTMNTHLHVLEAYTTLYRVWKDPVLKERLRGLIEIFLNKIIDQDTWHQHLFFTKDWQNLENIDSYGHDMELSWLLLEAAEVLDEEDIIEEVLPVGLKLVDTQMSEGWTKEGAMLYERNNGEIKGGLEWWPQAESVIAFYNAWQISNDEKYLDAAIKTWKWIESHLIDKEYGEWFGGLLPDGTPDRSRPKADLWKCPYHNSRMGFELFNRTH